VSQVEPAPHAAEAAVLANEQFPPNHPAFVAWSCSEQARARLLLGAVVPPTVAQPACMTRSLREYDDVSVWNFTSVA